MTLEETRERLSQKGGEHTILRTSPPRDPEGVFGAPGLVDTPQECLQTCGSCSYVDADATAANPAPGDTRTRSGTFSTPMAEGVRLVRAQCEDNLPL
jgi:hypothetical protein